MLSSLICLVGGAGDLVGGGDCWDCGVKQASQVQSLFLVANSPTCDVAITYWTGILCSRAWVRMYIARHL